MRLVANALGQILLITACGGTPCCLALPDDTVKVRLFGTHNNLNELQVEGWLKDNRSVYKLKVGNDRRLHLDNGAGRSRPSAGVTIEGKNHPIRITLPDKTTRRYCGTIKIAVDENGDLRVTNLVPAQQYVASVVGSESLPHTPTEALKAQSILTQTLLARRQPSQSLNDTTETQAYLGADYARPDAQSAVRSTWGQRLEFQNQPIAIYFHSCCAGGTSSSRLFGSTRSLPTYDQPVKCQYCKKSNFWQMHTTTIQRQKFLKAFPGGIPKVTAQDESGRPLSVVFANHKQMTGYEFWLKLGQKFDWGVMPGTRFSLKENAAGDVELTSTGAGHGVGLCQWGAAGMAAEGKTCKSILDFYFPGATLTGGRK